MGLLTRFGEAITDSKSRALGAQDFELLSYCPVRVHINQFSNYCEAVGFLAVTAMIRVEARSPRFVHSLQVVVETLTGTGYGSDSPWETRTANLFVVAMDLSTFLILFVVFPYVFRPVLENAFSPSVPATVKIEDHVIVCGVPQLAD